MNAGWLPRLALLCPLLMLLPAAAAQGQEMVFQLDAAQSRVQFTLPATLHTVHGTFQLKSGTLRFNPSTGEASGSLVLDATTGQSGNKSRDRRMHRQILEDQKYPDIIFTPQRVTGKLSPQGTSQVELQGIMTLQGRQHPMSVSMPVQIDHDQVSADARFVVPYVAWGLKNPSTFVLRVSDKVTVEVHAVGRVTQGSVAAASPPSAR